MGDAHASAGSVLPGLNSVGATRLGDNDGGVLPRMHCMLRRVGVALRRARCTGGVRDMLRRMSMQLRVRGYNHVQANTVPYLLSRNGCGASAEAHAQQGKTT